MPNMLLLIMPGHYAERAPSHVHTRTHAHTIKVVD